MSLPGLTPIPRPATSPTNAPRDEAQAFRPWRTNTATKVGGTRLLGKQGKALHIFHSRSMDLFSRRLNAGAIAEAALSKKRKAAGLFPKARVHDDLLNVLRPGLDGATCGFCELTRTYLSPIQSAYHFLKSQEFPRRETPLLGDDQLP